MIISIIQRMAYAASDASVKDSSIGGYWILADEHKRFKKEQILYHKQWNNNSSGVAEVLVLLELLEVMEYKGQHIEEGKISIGFDHRQAYKKIVSQIKRNNVYAQESGAEISCIKDLL